MCFRGRMKATELGHRVNHACMVAEQGEGTSGAGTCPLSPPFSLLHIESWLSRNWGRLCLPEKTNSPLSSGGYQEWLKPATHSGPRPEISNLSEVILAICPTWGKVMSPSLACEESISLPGRRWPSIARSHVVSSLSLHFKWGTKNDVHKSTLYLGTMKCEARGENALKLGQSLVPVNIGTGFSLHLEFYYHFHISTGTFKSIRSNV